MDERTIFRRTLRHRPSRQEKILLSGVEIKDLWMILLNPCGFNDHHCNVAPAQALVLRLKSLKEGVRPKTKQDSQCESCLLCSLTPARMIRIKRITSDEA